MSTVLKFRRGDTTAANAFTGAEGELFVDTTKDTLVVHDGVTAGGVPLATESYVSSAISTKADSSSLATVATSGSYNDLTNKPSIPSLTGYATESYVNSQGFITSTALSGYATESYVNSQGFITSTALSGYATESYVNSQGFITSLAGYATESYVNSQGFITLSSLNGYATESYVGTQLGSKQDTLVSGTNIKTINGVSLLGSGSVSVNGITNSGKTVTLDSTGSINLPANASILNSSIAIATTSPDQVIDSFSSTTYKSAKYIIQAVTSSGDVHATEALIIHNGSTAFIVEYGTVYTSTALFTIDATINSGNVDTTITPASSDITIDLIRTALSSGQATSSLAGDLMTLTGTEDLLSGSGSEDLNV